MPVKFAAAPRSGNGSALKAADRLAARQVAVNGHSPGVGLLLGVAVGVLATQFLQLGGNRGTAFHSIFQCRGITRDGSLQRVEQADGDSRPW